MNACALTAEGTLVSAFAYPRRAGKSQTDIDIRGLSGFARTVALLTLPVNNSWENHKADIDIIIIIIIIIIKVAESLLWRPT